MSNNIIFHHRIALFTYETHTIHPLAPRLGGHQGGTTNGATGTTLPSGQQGETTRSNSSQRPLPTLTGGQRDETTTPNTTRTTTETQRTPLHTSTP